MIIVKSCIKCNTNFNIEVTQSQAVKLINRHRIKDLIQDILPSPKYTSEQRKLFLSGMCNKCWDELFPKEDENDILDNIIQDHPIQYNSDN